MLEGPRVHHNQRGAALMVALLILLAITLLSATLMTTINTDTKIAGHSMRHSQALNAAEAGIGEAMARINNGDVPNNSDPQMVAQIFLANAGDVPVLTGDSVAMATAQPAGEWITYSDAKKGPNVLTVEYKTDANKTKIYRYNPSVSPAIQTASGMPIYVIKSTGRRGDETRRIVTEVVQQTLNLQMKGALACDEDVKFTGNAVACGFNHRADTPYDAGSSGRSGSGGCNENPGAQQWELGSGDVSGVWSTSNINQNGGAQGFPNTLDHQTGFYAGPWEAIGMTQAAFYQWVGPPQINAASLDGIVHLDDNSTGQDQSGGFAFHGATGSGFLYVDGDLTLNSGFTYRGLIYVEGDLKLNGHAWILGGVIVRGKSEIKFNGGATIIYSWDAIQQNVNRYGGQLVTLSWREIP